MENKISLGANESVKDKRTIKHSSLVQVVVPLIKGGYNYIESDIESQHNVGICTAISLIQEREKANGKKYSPDFQYLLQKKYYDGNWIEGSSILTSLKVANKIGFLPSELWTYTTEADRDLPYNQYIAKLQAIPESEVQRLIGLCVDKIAGYVSVDISDPQYIAKAINDSESGVLCRYEVGNEWWNPSWYEKDINPLRPPKIVISGHAIIKASFDFISNSMFSLANTWGTNWCRKGCADVIWDKYKPTECWLITKQPVISKFEYSLSIGMSGDLVKNLQNALKIKGYFNYESTGYFGIITWWSVKSFQKANGIPNTGYVGILTRTELNKQFKL